MTAMSPRPATPPTVYGIELGLSLAERRILVADNSAFNCRTLARFLQWAGVNQVAFATSGEDVLAQVESFRPDLIVLDMGLGGMDGVSVLRRLRADSRHRDLPIVMQSATPSDHLRTVCFQAGATDIISKPINPGECIARVRYHLERRALVDELKLFRNRIERDLSQARAMQLALAPEPVNLEALGRKHGMSIDGVFRSSDEIGGDFWTAFDFGPSRIGLFIADLSGHGIAAAINAFRLHTLISRAPAADLADPARLLTHLNARLHQILPVGQFATAFYGVIDIAAGTLRYASAGAPSPILDMDGDGRGFRLLDGSGLFLGAFSDAEYEDHVTDFPAGASLLLCSDGVTEANDADGVMLGEAGLAALAQTAAARNPDRLLHELMADFLPAYGDRLGDDLTMVWLRRHPAAATE